MGSSRFPGKPMAKIHGIPMIGHCYYRTSMCEDLLETYVATCDQKIYDYIQSIGGKVLMTADTHERASDRTAEAMFIIEDIMNEKVDIIVMVQGDEPMVTPRMISDSLKPFKIDKSVNVVNLMANIETIEEFEENIDSLLTGYVAKELILADEQETIRSTWLDWVRSNINRKGF